MKILPARKWPKSRQARRKVRGKDVWCRCTCKEMSVEQMPQKKGGFAPKSMSKVWCKNNWCLPKIFFEKNIRMQLANEQASKV